MFGQLSGVGSLLDELRRWDADWDDWFAGSPWVSGIRSVRQGTFPPLNVGVNPDGVDVYLFAAGVDPKLFNVSLQQNLLTISGERNNPTESGASYYRRERFGGQFQRVLTLPEDVDPDNVEASYKDGVLHVRIGRHEAAKPRRINVH